MCRSNWKGIYVNTKLYYNFFFLKKKKIFINSKNSYISLKFINTQFTFLNGKDLVKLQITKSMINKKFGSFISSKISGKHDSKSR